jgi:hypothetical protein
MGPTRMNSKSRPAYHSDAMREPTVPCWHIVFRRDRRHFPLSAYYRPRDMLNAEMGKTIRSLRKRGLLDYEASFRRNFKVSEPRVCLVRFRVKEQ